MKRIAQAALLVLCGLGLLHVSLLTDLCLRYVKEGMRPLLIVSGAVLLLLGLASAVLDRGHGRGIRSGSAGGSGGAGGSGDHRGDGREGGPGHGREDGPQDRSVHEPRAPFAYGSDGRSGYGQAGGTQNDPAHRHEDGSQEHPQDHHGHDHSSVPRVAWLLLLPALSLLCYAPPALGAYTASRQPPRPVTHTSDFDPLPHTSPVPMTLSDFTSRVQEDRTQAVRGRSIRMVGFVTPGGRAGDWDLTRIILNCCAADAQSVKVRIHGGPVLPANTWVSVTGTWHPGGRLGTRSAPVALDARTVAKVARPSNGYQDALPLG
ncbi:TIGR03943 family protein [Streptomyces sp. NPDC096012]|uniref:TIGR03943 family putative permease subunit n=1 Tax=Streptomyces sp. NPDC096012 TaxID=3155684 RepID=UPI00336A656A